MEYIEIDSIVIISLIVATIGIVCGLISYKAEVRRAPENKKRAVKLFASQVFYWVMAILLVVSNIRIYIVIN